jgi:8-oxo-dGTP pyrophosphatase MutT (NUDIX family)
MEVDRPAPGEELRDADAPPTTPRQAATVILLRGGQEALEVLLIKRNPAQRFMGGAWVFPGGAVDAAEADEDEAHRVAGVREVAEEVGITLPGPHALVAYSRWITPAQVKIRFDTRFFLAEPPPGQEATPDGDECVDAGWFTPAEALQAYQAGEIQLVFPTIKTLEQLSAYGSAAEALAAASARDVRPVEPRVVVEDDRARVVLPGEPGYDST